MKLPILVDSAIFSLESVKPLSQPILSLNQGLTTPPVDVEAIHTVEAVILLSLSREESDLVFVRDMYSALFHKLPPSRIDVMPVELCH